MNARALRKNDLKIDPAEPRERPILFSGPMVKAILEGRKTHTRRLVKMTPEAHRALANASAPLMVAPGYARWEGFPAEPPFKAENWNAWSPYGVPGERLWVREKWAGADQFYQAHENDVPRVVAYAADKSATQWDAEPPRKVPRYDIDQWNWDTVKWRPSIYMPKWACRLKLEITSVRVERLHDISDEDAVAEGCTGFDPDLDGGTYYHMAGRSTAPSSRAHFMHLWASINGHRAPWSTDPFVWIISFRVVL